MENTRKKISPQQSIQKPQGLLGVKKQPNKQSEPPPKCRHKEISATLLKNRKLKRINGNKQAKKSKTHQSKPLPQKQPRTDHPQRTIDLYSQEKTRHVTR